MSREGWGVEMMNQHEQAIGERRLMQLGLGGQTAQQPKPERAKTNQTKV
jgi:hypothetical protein